MKEHKNVYIRSNYSNKAVVHVNHTKIFLHKNLNAMKWTTYETKIYCFYYEIVQYKWNYHGQKFFSKVSNRMHAKNILLGFQVWLKTF